MAATSRSRASAIPVGRSTAGDALQPKPLRGIDPALRRKLLLLAVLAAAALVIHLWLLRPAADPLEGFPHAFLAAPTYDPGQVVIQVAPLSSPPPPPPGSMRAWRCDDPAYADASGRPWLFPVTVDGRGKVRPPVHPTRRTAPDPQRCRPYATADGERLLADYRTRNTP